MVKKIVIIATAILAIGLFLFIRKQNQDEARWEAGKNKYNLKIQALEKEQANVEREIINLDRFYGPKGTTQVIFTGLEKEVYTTCYPIMKELGYTGVLALSWTQIPGEEGYMSLEEFKELLTEGWSVCVKWDSETPVDQWWPKLQEQFTVLELEMSQVAYFTTDTYSSEIDAKLQELGFTIAIHHGEETESLVQLSDEEGIWHLGAVGLLGKKPKVRLEEAVAQKGNITYLVGFELKDEMYEEDSFRKMLGYFEAYENNYELLVRKPEEAREEYRLRVNPDEAVQQKYEEERTILLDKKTAIEEEIEKLKAQEE